ncbi:hypothetical protein [Arthrobacter agilis]|jgi:hypothetical protein|uniref:hypothetical protein n=1 Tax=Arthrobacter agilis TaxID=37921 RepID=UPI002789B3A0|nr:hypothetical protein [Arthrobacter agilis]MDQ0736178.1 hypothetical protein [Arthrobacter agilis]
MKIHRSPRKQPHPDSAPPSPPAGTTRHRASFFDGLDAAARTFLGPADRTDGRRPVIHQHDAAEDTSDATLSSIEVHTDSLGHHYAQRKAPLQRPGSD